jgi:LysR family transcriptional activator of nhaA
MATLNYKHLRYFWMVAKSGSIARASEQLHLTPQSISGQLSEFEASLGVELFRRVGRGLELTETGQHLLGYAEQIFTLGNELLDSLRTDTRQQSVPFRVGIADSVPKMVAYRLVEPSLSSHDQIKLICREGPPDQPARRACRAPDRHGDCRPSDAGQPECARLRSLSG